MELIMFLNFLNFSIFSEDDFWSKLVEHICNTISDNFYFNNFIFPP